MYQQILKFWFSDIDKSKWFAKDPQLDQQIYVKFSAAHTQAASGELWSWRASALGALAEIILLDQFSRNMFRDTEKAYAYDAVALVLAQNALSCGFDKQLNIDQQSFLYMPFMHSESLMIHETAVELFSKPGMEVNLDFELKHKKIIEQFARYPHRNKILGRISTPAELEFLTKNDSSF